jgi:hypothetical protein
MNFELLATIALALAAIPAVMFLWNLPQLKSPRIEPEQSFPPALQPVSVLIPARNESANIRGALTSVLENRNITFEVVVLDDHSDDDTAAVVREFAACDLRVRLETAPTLPAGWCGKQHACHVLSQHANHPLLVFMDADVRLSPDALARMSAFLNAGSLVNRKSEISSPLALASGVPRQLTGSLLEKLLIPLIHFVLLGFLPIWRMRRCTKPAYGAGCGQLFIARADAYRAVGGHAAIRDSLHDGLKLPRAFRRAGFRTDLFDATPIASCRMYHNAREVVAGLTKNAHEGLAAPAQIGPWTLLLFGGQILPWLLLAGSPWLGAEVFRLSLLGAGFTLLPRALAAWRHQQSWLGAVLHPLGITAFLVVQWRALVLTFNRRPQAWKGRTYAAVPQAPPIIPPDAHPKSVVVGR